MPDQLGIVYEPAPVPPRLCNDPRSSEVTPELYELFERFTFEALDAGRTRIGARMIAERIRWETALRMSEDLKVNNNVVPELAREFVRRHPEHAGIFSFRGRG